MAKRKTTTSGLPKAVAVGKSDPAGPSPKAHLRFNGDASDAGAEPGADMAQDGLIADGGEHVGEDASEDESDDDEAPEAVSAVTGRQGAKRQEQALKDFEAAATSARRKANKSRDAKQKARAVPDRTGKATRAADTDHADTADLDEAAQVDAVTEDADEQDVSATAQPSGTKRYLDPSIFADASSHLSKAATESKAKRAAEQDQAKKDRKRRKQAAENVTTRQVGDLTVQYLPDRSTVAPQPRHTQASTFLKRRLYDENKHAVPKPTLAAKRSEGQRRKVAGSAAARKRRAPATSFVRSS